MVNMRVVARLRPKIDHIPDSAGQEFVAAQDSCSVILKTNPPEVSCSSFLQLLTRRNVLSVSAL